MTEYVRLDNVCEIIMGQSPPSDSYNEEGEGVPFYQGKADFSILYPTPRVYCTSSKKIVGKNTILLSVRAPVGSVNIANGECCIGRGLAGIIANGELIDTMYLYYYFKAREKIIADMGGGSTFKSITKKQVHSLTLPLPPLEEQKRIAAALDKMSSVIAKRKRQIALLDEAAKSLFVEMFGDPVENPMGWEIVELRALGDGKDAIKCGPFGTQLSKSEYRTEGVPVWGIPEINSSFSKMPSDFVTPEKAEILDSYSVIPNDIVMSRKGTIGKCALYPKNLSKGIIHSDVLRIRPNSGIVNSYFLKYQLHISQYIASQIEGVSNGAIMKGINVTKLKQILIHLPPLDLQNLFAARIEALEAQRASCERGLKQMETAFAAMMQEYFG